MLRSRLGWLHGHTCSLEAAFSRGTSIRSSLNEKVKTSVILFGHDLCAWSAHMAETVQSAHGEERAMTPRVEKVGLGYKVSKGMPWLDSIAATMEQAFKPVLGQDAPRGPRDFLYGTWLGHSLHAAVITVPVGSWSAAMIFDVMGEERAADLSLGLGLVGAAGAAVTGAAQWQDTTNEEDPRRLGALHALLNVAATSLMAGSWLLRLQGRRGPGVALSTLGLGVNLASAWLGGELAYELGIGVNHAAFERPPSKWTDVAAVRGLADGKPQTGGSRRHAGALAAAGRSNSGDRRHMYASWRSPGRGPGRWRHRHLPMARVGLLP